MPRTRYPECGHPPGSSGRSPGASVITWAIFFTWVLATPQVGWAGTFFSSRTDYETGTEPLAIAAADLNADGHVDLVTASNSADSISVLLGNGGGTLQNRTDYWAPGSHYAVAIGLLNGDAVPDLVVVNDLQNTVSVLLGTGDGTFGAPSDFGVGSYPESVEIADLNGDAHADLVVGNAGGAGSVSVLLGNGDGSFGTKVDYPTRTGPEAVVARDLNGDAHLDLIVANAGFDFSEYSISVLLGNGDGTFRPKTDFPAGREPASLATGDLNGDGKLDVVTGNFTGTISVLLGNGNGAFGANLDSTVLGKPTSVALADFDRDGKLDLVVGNDFSLTFVLSPGNGDGTFGPKTDCPSGLGPRTIAVADLDEDGLLDLAVANRGQPFSGYAGSTVSVFLNCGPCSPTAIEVVPLTPEVKPDRVRVVWDVGGNPNLIAMVQRRSESTDWIGLGPASDDGESHLFYLDYSVAPGQRYGYRLRTLDGADEEFVGEVWVEVPREGSVPAVARLEPAIPNPATTQTRVDYAVPAAGYVRIAIYDIHGRKVAALVNGIEPAGWHSASWSGRGESGQEVASGTYFIRLETLGKVRSRKVVIAK